MINGELMLISYAEWFRAAAEILGMQILSIDGLVIISSKHCRTGLLEMQHLGWISIVCLAHCVFRYTKGTKHGPSNGFWLFPCPKVWFLPQAGRVCVAVQLEL